MVSPRDMPHSTRRCILSVWIPPVRWMLRCALAAIVSMPWRASLAFSTTRTMRAFAAVSCAASSFCMPPVIRPISLPIVSHAAPRSCSTFASSPSVAFASMPSISVSFVSTLFCTSAACCAWSFRNVVIAVSNRFWRSLPATSLLAVA